jgi:hypothetical protein
MLPYREAIGGRGNAPKGAETLVDLVGIEPTTSSMPWNDKNNNLLTAKTLIVG